MKRREIGVEFYHTHINNNPTPLGPYPRKAHTHKPIFTESAVESAVEAANSTEESVNSTTEFAIVCREPILNMFNMPTAHIKYYYEPTGIGRLLQSADYCNRPTIAIGRLLQSAVGKSAVGKSAK